nr:sirohydrochlorin cobaltochelatase [Parabacteroides goldsteinii]
MNKFKYCLMAAALMTATTVGFTSCGDDDDVESTVNPAEQYVKSVKTKDTAILLCSFGSTYNEATHVYDDIVSDFKAAFPDADVYLSFSSNTCIGRLEATRDTAYYHVDTWLNALAENDYKKVAVQSLHVIPGEEYLAVMNGTVKKNFMIRDYPSVNVLRSANLLAEDEDTEAVATVLYNHYKTSLADKHNVLLLMGHGNPDDNYNANQKYSDIEAAMQAKTTDKNVFVGTVDYGKMLFWPMNEKTKEPLDTPNPECVYSKLMAYCKTNNLEPKDINIFLAPFMSIAGDHAHNDLWGLEDGDDFSNATPQSDNCWRLRLQYLGFNIDQTETHPADQSDADHGIETGCKIKALGDYPEIRQIWLNHLKENWNDADAWENGEGYQPE